MYFSINRNNKNFCLEAAFIYYFKLLFLIYIFNRGSEQFSSIHNAFKLQNKIGFGINISYLYIYKYLYKLLILYFSRIVLSQFVYTVSIFVYLFAANLPSSLILSISNNVFCSRASYLCCQEVSSIRSFSQMSFKSFFSLFELFCHESSSKARS